MKQKAMVCAVGIALVGALSAVAAEKEKPSAELQEKVTQVIKTTFPDASITSMAKANEEGVDVISIKFTSKGNKMDADVTPDGVLVGTEEAADIQTFPKRAANALKTATKGMKATFEIARTYARSQKDASGVVSVVKLAEPIVAYEADVEKDGKTGEFVVSAEGKILEKPKWVTSGKSQEEDEKDEKEEKHEKK